MRDSKSQLSGSPQSPGGVPGSPEPLKKKNTYWEDKRMPDLNPFENSCDPAVKR
jgi:hypothetical protein